MKLRALVRGLDARTLLVVGLAVAVVFAYAAAVSLSRDYYVVQSPPGSVFNAEPEGLNVLFDYLEALDVPVETLHSFDELPREGTIVAASTEPFAKAPTQAEGVRLSKWVAAGNRLVLAGPSAREVLRGAGIGGNSPRTTDSVSLSPRLPSAYVYGVSEVRSGPERLLANNAEWATHLGDADGQVMLTRSHGAGEIVWVASVYPFSNEGLAAADNARFATLLAASGGPVYFNEYHHGFVRGGGVWERLGPGGRAASVLALIAVVLLLLALSQRFGRPIEPVVASEARTGAYIGSLAELYRKAGARAEALASLEEGVRLALVRRHGTEEAGKAAHVAAARALNDSAAARTGGRIDTDRFTAIAGALAQARREVEGLDG